MDPQRRREKFGRRRRPTDGRTTKIRLILIATHDKKKNLVLGNDDCFVLDNDDCFVLRNDDCFSFDNDDSFVLDNEDCFVLNNEDCFVLDMTIASFSTTTITRPRPGTL